MGERKPACSDHAGFIMLARHVAGIAAVTMALGIANLAATPSVAGSSDFVVAQAGDVSTANSTARYHRRRLTVYPSEGIYRECNSWLQLQHRPSGDVLYPQVHCYWTRR